MGIEVQDLCILYKNIIQIYTNYEKSTMDWCKMKKSVNKIQKIGSLNDGVVV